MNLDFNLSTAVNWNLPHMRRCRIHVTGMILLASWMCRSAILAYGDEWAGMSKRTSQPREAGEYAEAEKIERHLLAMAFTLGAKAGTNPADDGFLTLSKIYELNIKGNEL